MVSIRTLELTEETPLVGFHGMVDEFGILSLAPILLDTLESICQEPLDHSDMSMYQGMDAFETSKVLEDSITHDEYVRAQALETILKYDSLKNARESKE